MHAAALLCRHPAMPHPYNTQLYACGCCSDAALCCLLLCWHRCWHDRFMQSVGLPAVLAAVRCCSGLVLVTGCVEKAAVQLVALLGRPSVVYFLARSTMVPDSQKTYIHCPTPFNPAKRITYEPAHCGAQWGLAFNMGSRMLQSSNSLPCAAWLVQSGGWLLVTTQTLCAVWGCMCTSLFPPLLTFAEGSGLLAAA